MDSVSSQFVLFSGMLPELLAFLTIVAEEVETADLLGPSK